MVREQLNKIRDKHIGNNPHPPSSCYWGFNVHNKSESPLCRIEGQILVDIINDHGFEKIVNSTTRERDTLDLLPIRGQLFKINDIVS